ncbi:MAG: radical SAM protein, partial [Candidatus Hydrogenedentota bacterium]
MKEQISINDLRAPIFIAWQLNSACNLDCLHCCEESGLSIPDELTKDEIIDFMNQIKSLDIPYVAISGGEPLLHPYFFDICDFFHKHKISLKIETNGEFIDNKIAKKFANLKLRSVQVSLDGATPPTHEKLRVMGDWNKVLAACKNLLKEGVNTEIVFVPTKFNIQEIGELIDLSYSLGIYGVYTGKIMRVGRAAQNWDILAPSEKDYETFFEVLTKKVDQYQG